ncbi:MAG: hypothetical protein ACHP7N_19565, partial [Caulobacterales bacterium]
MIPNQRRPSSALALVLAALWLAGCNQNQGTAQSDAQGAPPPLPLTTDAPPAVSAAPAAEALPAAPAAGVSYLDNPDEQYAYADRASSLANALGDAPPDYAFDYQGAQPWAWRGGGYLRVAEPTPDGERDYYYDAGSSYPYLIQDGPYGYAYSGSDLVVVYGQNGRVLPRDEIQARTDIAGRYLARARDLHEAALAGSRQGVAVSAWRNERPAFASERERWTTQQERFAPWRAYHETHQAEDQAYWQDEHDRRAAETQAYHQALGPAGGPPPAAAALAAAVSAYGAAQTAPPRPSPPQTHPTPAGAPSGPHPQFAPQAAPPATGPEFRAPPSGPQSPPSQHIAPSSPPAAPAPRPQAGPPGAKPEFKAPPSGPQS